MPPLPLQGDGGLLIFEGKKEKFKCSIQSWLANKRVSPPAPLHMPFLPGRIVPLLDSSQVDFAFAAALFFSAGFAALGNGTSKPNTGGACLMGACKNREAGEAEAGR